MSEHHSISIAVPVVCLSEGDRRDVMTVVQDRFQSLRARKRATALEVLSQGRSLLEAQQASGLNAEMLRALLDRFRKEGVKGALFGLHRAPSACRYDQDAIVEALKILVVSRPVSGLYWTLRSLADEIGKMVPGGGDISHEHLRQIMLKRLGIRSIRHIEPYWKQQLARKVASVA